MSDASDDWGEPEDGPLRDVGEVSIDTFADIVIAWDESYRQLCSSVDVDAIGSELARQSSRYQEWSDQLAEARRAYAYAHLASKDVYARLLVEAKQRRRADGKMCTEKEAVAYAETDTRWHRVKGVEIEHATNVAKLSGTLEAQRMKRDAIVQIAALRREEFKALKGS